MRRVDLRILNRIDLADIHDPDILAAVLHCQLGEIDGPIPVVAVATALGIGEVRQTLLDGFEGMLITDMCRSSGKILANSAKGRQRARFTIAHELGHYLLENHVPAGTQEHGFMCSGADLDGTRHHDPQQARQEDEANRFAIALLVPDARLGILQSNATDLGAIVSMADRLKVSLQALARRYVETHTRPVAVIHSHVGKITAMTRHKEFPWLLPNHGDALPRLSKTASDSVAARDVQCAGRANQNQHWIADTSRSINEQFHTSGSGHTTTLLWLD